MEVAVLRDDREPVRSREGPDEKIILGDVAKIEDMQGAWLVGVETRHEARGEVRIEQQLHGLDAVMS